MLALGFHTHTAVEYLHQLGFLVVVVGGGGGGGDGGRTRSVHDHFGTGGWTTLIQSNFGTCYMPFQPVLHQYKRVYDFGTVFGLFWYIMKSDCKKIPNNICVTDNMVCLIVTHN